MMGEKKMGTERPGVRTGPSLARTVQALRTIRGRRQRVPGARLNPR